MAVAVIMKLRLDKYLTEMGCGTRSQVKKEILKGSVSVNGEIAKKAERKVDTEKDEIIFKGEKIFYAGYEYFMLNKPAGVVSATEDKKERTVIDLIKESKRKDLFPAGRLDKDTEGLLLITNDGQPAQEIIDDNPDGIMLSNGPGDPKECTGVIAEIKKLYDTEIPIFAICLGHQLMALATGADTHKMKYGHRGGNHPVKDLMTGRVYISSQNHGYVVDTDKLDPSVAVPAFINVNDGTNEGLSYTGKNIFTVQFHPEACPGPQDSGYLFDRFIHMMRGEN